jgi:hypothetical protein
MTVHEVIVQQSLITFRTHKGYGYRLCFGSRRLYASVIRFDIPQQIFQSLFQVIRLKCPAVAIIKGDDDAPQGSLHFPDFRYQDMNLAGVVIGKSIDYFQFILL